MKLNIVSVLAFIASVAIAADTPSVSDLPTCARSCVTSGFAGCDQLNVSCICGNTQLINNLSCCVSKSCNAADQQATINFAVQICSANGVSVPTQASCSAGASSTGSSTAAASSSAQSTTGSATSAMSATSAAASAASSKAAAAQNVGSGVGMGLAMAGVLAML